MPFTYFLILLVLCVTINSSFGFLDTIICTIKFLLDFNHADRIVNDRKATYIQKLVALQYKKPSYLWFHERNKRKHLTRL